MRAVDGREVRGSLSREVDVVVVGSGPAGSAVAREVAASGASVCVVEAGPWMWERPPATSLRAMSEGYRAWGASVAWGRPPLPLVQGRMVGGSSPVNGAICWRLPEDVRAAWVAQDPDLAEVLDPERLAQVTDAIEARWGVAPTDPAVAGRKNALLAQGAEALGLAHAADPPERPRLRGRWALPPGVSARAQAVGRFARSSPTRWGTAPRC